MRLTITLLLVLLLFVPLSVAQTTSATVTGRVLDPSNAVIPDATVSVTNRETNSHYSSQTTSEGTYVIPGLPPGRYRIEVSKQGFKTVLKDDVVLHVQDVVALNFTMPVGSISESITVIGGVPLVETESATQGSVLDNRAIQEMPVNGRNYLDLMQLVSGVTINRQSDQGSDVATPVLGERAGNTGFFIDGHDNTDQVNGGAASQFNQETIAEFRVETTGYKAEFGHSSGGVVNVITRSGTNSWHGFASAFHRNNVFDSANTSGLIPAPAPEFSKAPYLVRWDTTVGLGGPLVKDKVFLFASAERIHESRQLNFVFPPNTPAALQTFERGFDNPNATRETRAFGKLEEQLGRHHLSQEVNWTNQVIKDFLPLSEATNLPSTRTNSSARHLLIGGADTILLGQESDPYVLTLRGQYRDEPSWFGPAHPEAGPYTYFIMFSGYYPNMLIGDLGIVNYGSSLTPSQINQKYGAASANIAKHWGRHNFKLGWEFLRTQVDGVESNLEINQVYATLDDWLTFGPIDAGAFTLYTIGGETPQANQIGLRNNYNGLYLQDDWKVTQKLTLNLGVRWDYDSKFKTATNVSPRLGFAWAVTPKTVIRGSWGYFYDRFRLGLARDIPGFGGADLRTIQPLGIPRLFYGNPSTLIDLAGICINNTMTDAQIAGQTCPFNPIQPYFGVDHLNNVVAPGHAPIPANYVVNVDNIEQLSGLPPQQYADAASAAIGQAPGYFYWGPFGALNWNGWGPGGAYPVVVDPRFATPYTSSFSATVEHQFTDTFMIGGDFYHKDIYNILGVRQTNIRFENRIPENEFVGEPFENGYGPWYTGTYDGFGIRFNKGFSHRFTLAGSYNYGHGTDDALCSNFNTTLTGTCHPSDSYVGMTTVVTDPATGQTNANGPFTASNGNYVPKAGIFWNGPSLDYGPSDFGVTHVFQVSGSVQLPWRFEVSDIFRVQSGFHFSRLTSTPVDQDGNFEYSLVDLSAGRNHFTAPSFVNMDVRLSRQFEIGERVKLRAMFEVFNLFNSANPAAVEQYVGQSTPFGKPLQVLPGREGQIGLRIEF